MSSNTFSLHKNKLYEFLNDQFDDLLCFNDDGEPMQVSFYCPENDDVDDWLTDWCKYASKKNKALSFDWEYDSYSYQIEAKLYITSFKPVQINEAELEPMYYTTVIIDDKARMYNEMCDYLSQKVFTPAEPEESKSESESEHESESE